ncbi:hypothetical protein ACLMJK_009382 [Lecanora helva]
MGTSTAASSSTSKFSSYTSSPTASVTSSDDFTKTPATSGLISNSSPTSTPAPASAILGQSAKVGIGVGVSVGSLLIVLLAFTAYRLHRNTKRSTATLARVGHMFDRNGLKEQDFEPKIRLRHELADASTHGEMPTCHNTHEVE